MFVHINFFFVFLAEVVARVQALRLNQNPKDDAIIREKVSDTARLVRDVHQRYLKRNYHELVRQKNYIFIYILVSLCWAKNRRMRIKLSPC